jgi:hypothetical protein
MRAPREAAEHAGGVAVVSRLGEQVVIHDDDGICAEHGRIRVAAEYRLGFFERQAFRGLLRTLAAKRLFRNLSGDHVECDSGIAQQFTASRRR